jgi:Arc/MetJ-type ribon-helix-helix transcriptional regulator
MTIVLKRGEYDSPDALVGTAVQCLIEDDREEDAHREDLLAQIDAAEAEIDRGEYVEYDADSIHELAKDVHERGLQKMSAQGGKTGTRG